ncbi:MAG: phenylalanine--tRNA ligase subunit alpha [Nitrospirae bacterium]|nr:phenylalanine--tRNA ligase subunit alpha [Nitrospirota bacterium]
MNEIEKIKEEFQSQKADVRDLNALRQLKARYIGKKGIVTQKVRSLSSLPKEERPRVGRELNLLKSFIEEELKKLEKALSEEEAKRNLLKDHIDITLPGKYIEPGSYHPINQVLQEIIDIFVTMGFSVEEGPEVELDYYNFEALNIPREHPARDMQDTFYIRTETSDDFIVSDVVLRTHTSPVQIRGMEKRKPPFRFIAPGKVYRCDSDVSHTPMFHQVEGLMVGEDVTFADLKGVLEIFVHQLFGPQTPVRFRPSYFPFTEPSAEVDIGCILCGGKGCRVCKGTGWLEVLGAGMVHPKVFESVGYDTERYKGFAFGMGVERLTMLKYGIDDIRLFFENDLRFLRQF